MEKLISTITYIVNRSEDLKNKFTDATSAPVEFACIFCQNEEEYKQFTSSIEMVGKIAETTQTGFTYLLNEPIDTTAGPLRLVKIRIPDTKFSQIGDVDFNTDYDKFKDKYQNHPKFTLVKRDTFEMLRLSDSSSDVMACFSNTPKSEYLGIKLQR